ncbi:MAG TPA: PAS domain-containing protein, partial [Thermoanaerobaculia bacterium]
MPDAIVLIDGGGHIEFINARAGQMFGYRSEELAGKPIDVLLTGHRREVYIEHRLCNSAGRRKDGTSFPVEISRSLAEAEEGSPIIFAIRETSECKVAQPGFARVVADLGGQTRLLDLAYDAILVRDMDRTITFWNRGAEVLYGWAKGEALGRTVHELLKTEYPGSIEDIEAEVLRAGRWEGELGHHRRDGSRVVMASRWALQRDDQGQPLGILEINSDITDRKSAEEALRAHVRQQAAV